jgi:hypothetical protein
MNTLKIIKINKRGVAGLSLKKQIDLKVRMAKQTISLAVSHANRASMQLVREPPAR